MESPREVKKAQKQTTVLGGKGEARKADEEGGKTGSRQGRH